MRIDEIIIVSHEEAVKQWGVVPNFLSSSRSIPPETEYTLSLSSAVLHENNAGPNLRKHWRIIYSIAEFHALFVVARSSIFLSSVLKKWGPLSMHRDLQESNVDFWIPTKERYFTTVELILLEDLDKGSSRSSIALDATILNSLRMRHYEQLPKVREVSECISFIWRHMFSIAFHTRYKKNALFWY